MVFLSAAQMVFEKVVVQEHVRALAPIVSQAQAVAAARVLARIFSVRAHVPLAHKPAAVLARVLARAAAQQVRAAAVRVLAQVQGQSLPGHPQAH